MLQGRRTGLSSDQPPEKAELNGPKLLLFQRRMPVHITRMVTGNSVTPSSSSTCTQATKAWLASLVSQTTLNY
eukprot:2496442-Amphidinium_carterae.1